MAAEDWPACGLSRKTPWKLCNDSIRLRDWVTALGANEYGNQLRQASPLACLLPTERRLEIIRATATHRNQLQLLGSENIAKASAIAMRA